MSTKFQKGDKVVVSALGNKVGIVDGEARQVKGQWFYPVSFNLADPSPWYPETALAAYTHPKTVPELLAGKEKVATVNSLVELTVGSLHAQKGPRSEKR